MSRPYSSESVYRAIGHPIRRQLLDLLRDKERTVNELAGHFSCTVGAVSQHLRILRETGLVAQRRVRLQRMYNLVPRNLNVLHDWLRPYQRAGGASARSHASKA